jgi:hypothetical protein
MQSEKEWGIYVYFAADVPSPAMGRAAQLNLLKLAEVGSNDKIGITALIDLPDVDTQLYVIPEQTQDGEEWLVSASASVSNVDSANTDTIREFFQWSVAHCPAKKIAFVFWGHGYAIDDFDPRLDPLPPATQEEESAEEDELGRDLGSESGEGPSATEISADRFARSRNLPLKLLFDASHNSVLNNDQVADVIRKCRRSLPKGNDLVILGLDCCNMAMAEVMCEMEGCAQIAVAAETGMPFQSWISQSMLQKFLAYAPSDPRDFAVGAVQDFIQTFDGKSSAYVALSACDLTLCSKLEAAAARLAKALIEAARDSTKRAAIFRSRDDSVSFDPDGLIDFDCFCGFLSEDLPGTPVAAACADVRQVLQGFVIIHKFAPNLPDRKISLSTGLSIWFPPWIEDPAVEIPQKEQSIKYFLKGYQRTKFAGATNWNEFLSSLLVTTHGSENMEAVMAESSQSGNDQLGRVGAILGRDATVRGRDATVRGRDATVRGRDAQIRGRVTGNAGQGDETDGQGVSGICPSREAGVVIRAFVDAYGPVGDTELSVNVKWPAASIGYAPSVGDTGQEKMTAANPRITRFSSPSTLLVRRVSPLLSGNAGGRVRDGSAANGQQTAAKKSAAKKSAAKKAAAKKAAAKKAAAKKAAANR